MIRKLGLLLLFLLFSINSPLFAEKPKVIAWGKMVYQTTFSDNLYTEELSGIQLCISKSFLVIGWMEIIFHNGHDSQRVNFDNSFFWTGDCTEVYFFEWGGMSISKIIMGGVHLMAVNGVFVQPEYKILGHKKTEVIKMGELTLPNKLPSEQFLLSLDLTVKTPVDAIQFCLRKGAGRVQWVDLHFQDYPTVKLQFPPPHEYIKAKGSPSCYYVYQLGKTWEKKTIIKVFVHGETIYDETAPPPPPPPHLGYIW
jgi:hypothetical protein